MRLRNCRLINFRCFEDLDVALDAHLNVFHGENGAGKSAVLDGIALGLSPILTHFPRLSGLNFKYTDIRRSDGGGKLAPFVRVGMETFEGISWDRTERRDKSAPTQKSIPANVGIKQLTTHLDDHITALNEGRPTTLPVFAYYGTNRALLELPVRRKNFQADFQPLQALSQALQPTSRFKTVFEWFDYAEDLERREQVKYRDFSYRDPLLSAVRVAVESMVPGVSNPRLERNPLHFMVTRRLADGSDADFMLEQLSDGYRTMLALTMDFARRLAQANPHLENPLHAEAMLLVDEIDLHLHPSWQQKVIPLLRMTFPNTQLILSTHSPQIISTVPKENVWEPIQHELSNPVSETLGAESGRILEDTFNVPQRPLMVPGTRELSAFLRALEDPEITQEQLISMRTAVAHLIAPDDPALELADIVIEQRAVLSGIEIELPPLPSAPDDLADENDN